MRHRQYPKGAEKGFTLVELSIVMIIIGLLIGGILKGQELIANSRLAASVARVKAIDAALNTFRDSYSALPGDIVGTRLPNCAATTACGSPIITGTRNDGHIGVTNVTGLTQITQSENLIAWAQLSATDLMGGVSNPNSGALVQEGTRVPAAVIPGQIVIGYENGAFRPSGYEGPLAAARAGHYLLIHQAVPAAAGAFTQIAASTTATLTPTQANRFDTKLDDGGPNSGSVLAMGLSDGSATACSTTATAAAIYNVAANQGIGCGVYIRIQQ